MWNAECGIDIPHSTFRIPHWFSPHPKCGIDIPHSTFRIPHWFSPHPEQLEPPLVALHDPLAIRRVLWLRERRVSRDDLARRAPGGLEQRQVGCEVRVAQRYPAGLSSARQLTHAPLLQIELGDLKPVGGLRARSAGAG